VVFSSVISERRKGCDDVIVTSLNRVRLYPCIINPTKFGEDRMKNARVIVLTSFWSQTDGQTLWLQYPSLPRGKKGRPLCGSYRPPKMAGKAKISTNNCHSTQKSPSQCHLRLPPSDLGYNLPKTDGWNKLTHKVPKLMKNSRSQPFFKYSSIQKKTFPSIRVDYTKRINYTIFIKHCLRYGFRRPNCG